MKNIIKFLSSSRQTATSILLSLCLVVSFILAPGASASQKRLGVWVSVFTPEKVMYSKQNTDKLIQFCTKCGINEIYIQVYRADKAYYNSSLTDKYGYSQMTKSMGTDPLQYLISRAKASNIRVYGWLNVFCIADNTNANIIKLYGTGILTKDQKGRLPYYEKDASDALDKYYIREKQSFLEPGDPRVRKYIVSIVKEIATKYPDLAGLHLDYVRYPYVIPFGLGSIFDTHTLSYGFTPANLENFAKTTGIPAKHVYADRSTCKKWDEWRRDQVTRMVHEISNAAKTISPSYEISCTIAPSIERTYTVTFQDWTTWLQKGYADYVMVMNYTEEPAFSELRAKSMLLPGINKQVCFGIGAHLLKSSPGIFEKEFDDIDGLSCRGAAIFSYDDLITNKELTDFLAERAHN
ncbi:MAG TPA: family 10 glycosylhydrolase [Candidatus Omnitrophota bacterium]|nr:family 10 glycosylhydrolase [Candidatus Omnitrophota bacterium]HPS19656.1 family 10 glycosylhydrolase [Candidatus Omnitrophota bacterium]